MQVRELIVKLRKAADALEELMGMSDSRLIRTSGTPMMIKTEFPNMDPDQHLNRLISKKRQAFADLKLDQSVDYDKLRQPKTKHQSLFKQENLNPKKHWMQQPKNRKKMLAVIAKMHKGLKTKKGK